ncbi:hypothetical protein QP097_07520 [Oligella urethralis]|uniref:hypothetical protein n=1 Tax=Oligella urethralis TaxID=90245 RepID=UPI00254D9DAF|nr:hypothetical protein [Oligella urethralis]MDK6203307.1 hypothetical protein [Oligella urethralis]
MFLIVSRSRQYIVSMSGGVPLPLSAADITAVLDAYPSPLPREELDIYLFALDAEILDGDKPKKQENVESIWSSVVSDING